MTNKLIFSITIISGLLSCNSENKNIVNTVVAIENKGHSEQLHEKFFESFIVENKIDKQALIFYLNSTGCGSCDDLLIALSIKDYKIRKYLLLKEGDTLSVSEFNQDKVIFLDPDLLRKFELDLFYGFAAIIKDGKFHSFIHLDKDRVAFIEKEIKNSLELN